MIDVILPVFSLVFPLLCRLGDVRQKNPCFSPDGLPEMHGKNMLREGWSVVQVNFCQMVGTVS